MFSLNSSKASVTLIHLYNRTNYLLQIEIYMNSFAESQAIALEISSYIFIWYPDFVEIAPNICIYHLRVLYNNACAHSIIFTKLLCLKSHLLSSICYRNSSMKTAIIVSNSFYRFDVDWRKLEKSCIDQDRKKFENSWNHSIKFRWFAKPYRVSYYRWK